MHFFCQKPDIKYSNFLAFMTLLRVADVAVGVHEDAQDEAVQGVEIRYAEFILCMRSLKETSTHVLFQRNYCQAQIGKEP